MISGGNTIPQISRGNECVKLLSTHDYRVVRILNALTTHVVLNNYRSTTSLLEKKT